MKLLIIEDEPEMLENMVQTLERQHYVVETASDYKSALHKIGVYDYDCILLDITLPDGNGLELLKALKSSGKDDGVIIVSAKDSLDDRLEGLNLGADDYLPKPFHMAELHARVKAVLRRRHFEGNQQINIGNVAVAPESREVKVDGNPIVLNRKEYDILMYLITNKKRLVTKSALAEHVWGDHIDQADSFDFIYSQIKNLRKKLEHATITIEAVYGVGYKLEVM
ncbi:response regulator transcription factor [Gelidibacter salicanalis]|uniref:Response regulator transcription factor n=1 Tax=Gelidibacter salicanalis TaxID=291193 RepID=A0A934NJ17_9FLAO|nr:response regulator transcription factor [Gelidibacter salicanalis]MBJ7882841.1 response regulator transcription factor [Gelidibacter salicanalis]